MSFLISDAFAQATSTAANAAHPKPTVNLILMLLIFVSFIYFLIWRPQSKRAKAQSNMISALKKGDEVVTNGGLLGKIKKIEENFFVLEISKETEVKIQKVAISSVLPKGTVKEVKEAK